MARLAVFDLDGTLLDSDAALLAPFAALGVDPSTVPLGLPAAEACALAGITLEGYVAHYDTTAVAPLPGVDELLARLDRWGVASNKTRSSGQAELDRLGWAPEIARFSEDFDGAGKSLEPVLAVLGVAPAHVVYVGDTDHDRACAARAGTHFALAGWNPRARLGALAGDLVLDHPLEVLDLLAALN